MWIDICEWDNVDTDTRCLRGDERRLQQVEQRSANALLPVRLVQGWLPRRRQEGLEFRCTVSHSRVNRPHCLPSRRVPIMLLKSEAFACTKGPGGANCFLGHYSTCGKLTWFFFLFSYYEAIDMLYLVTLENLYHVSSPHYYKYDLGAYTKSVHLR